MTENKRYSFNWKSGHPNFWDNHCDLADCYLTCGDVVNILNELNDENEQLKQQLKLKEAEERINCRYCIYFILGSSSDSCLKREDIGYKGTCIDGMDYHYLAKNCPYYEKGDVE